MDLDEWEVIPSTKSYKKLGHASKELLFVKPDLFVETDYFKCPSEEEPSKEFKDIGISAEFREEPSSPAPAPAPPTSWVEPDPVVLENEKEEAMVMPIQMERKTEVVVEEEKDCENGFNLWGLRVSVNGIGAICSFGVATAATLCVFALGTASASASASGRVRPNPNIQFQIYSDDKRIKDVVQRATGLNHAMSAARGITIPTAQISFGGHYEGL